MRVVDRIGWSKNEEFIYVYKMKNIHPQLKAVIVLDRRYKGMQRSSEAIERNISKSEIDNIIYEFKIIRRIAQKKENPSICEDQSSIKDLKN